MVGYNWLKLKYSSNNKDDELKDIVDRRIKFIFNKMDLDKDGKVSLLEY